MEYITLLQGIVDMIAITILLICIIDYFKVSHEVKEKERIVDELIEELKLRRETKE